MSKLGETQAALMHQDMKTKEKTREVLTRTRRIIEHDIGITMNDLLAEATGEVAMEMAQGTYMDPASPTSRVIENYGGGSKSFMKPVAFGDWQPIPVLKENSAGKETMVYKVRHNNGKLFETTFRHDIVARTVAAMLNESNNPNDPRLNRILELCRKEESVMLELRQNKRMFESATDKRQKATLKNKFEENKLLLAGVRSKLGVS